MAAPAIPVEPAETEETVPARKSSKKLIIIAGALVVLLGGGAGAWFFMHGAEDPKGKTVEPAKPPVYLPLETFTVNLQGSEQYLQTDITLQVADSAQVEAIKAYMPRVRSRLLTLLSSKQADELVTPADKKKLAQEILAQAKLPFAPNGKPQQVDDVLFTTFVIQ
ncbi:MAG: flagellar basal body-associated protein FliL [Pseudomonadota bacterium]